MATALHSTKRIPRVATQKNSSQNIQDWFENFEIQTARYSEIERGQEVPIWFEDLAQEALKMMPDDKFSYKHIKAYMLTNMRSVHKSTLMTEFFAIYSF